MKVKLLRLNVENLNGRIYQKDKMEEAVSDFNERVNSLGVVYGQLGPSEDLDTSLTRISHTIDSIQFEGDFLTGNITPIDTPFGRELSDSIESYVFRPNSLGLINDDKSVTVQKIVTFNAIPIEEDSWSGMMVDKSNIFKKLLKDEDKLDNFTNYMKYQLTMMDPLTYDFESLSSEEKRQTYEKMMYHKDLHDNCMKLLISKDVDPDQMMGVLVSIIEYHLDSEEYEEIPFYQNIIDAYESAV